MRRRPRRCGLLESDDGYDTHPLVSKKLVTMLSKHTKKRFYYIFYVIAVTLMITSISFNYFFDEKSINFLFFIAIGILSLNLIFFRFW